VKRDVAPVGVRRIVAFKRLSGRNSRDLNPDRSVRETILAMGIKGQVHLLPGMKNPKTFHIQMTLMSPAAARGVHRVNDTPTFLAVPLPHNPHFAHFPILAQTLPQCPQRRDRGMAEN